MLKEKISSGIIWKYLRTVCFVLAVVFLSCTFMTRPVQAAIASGTAPGGCPWTITNDRELVIGEPGRTYTLGPLNQSQGTYYAPWSSYSGAILSVKFEGTVNGSGSLSSLFETCVNMTSVSGNLNTDNVTNMSRMFYACQNMEDFSFLSSWNVRNVTNMSRMFYACQKLENISSVSSWDVQNVTDMTSMFCACSKLKKVDALSDWNVQNVTNMKEMFAGCSVLTDVSGLSEWNTSNVENMSGMFQDARQLQARDSLKNWNTSNCTNMASMFYNCNAITKLDITNWDTTHANMDGAFISLTRLQKIKVGNGFMFSGSGSMFPNSSAPHCEQGTWVRDDGTYGPLSYYELWQQYVQPDWAGTWVLQETPYKYTVKFVAPEGASGSMPDQIMEYDRTMRLNECTFKKFDHHFVKWIGDDGKEYTDKARIYMYSFNPGDVLTLTAVFEKNEHNVSIAEGVAEFILHAGEKLILPKLPGGSKYQVWEETPSGWQLKEEKNATGDIPANGTANAEFTNEYVPGTTTVQLIASKTMDGTLPEDGAFTFQLKKDGEVVQEATNNGAGVVLFDTLIFRQPGEYTYTISEVRGDSGSINYDTHEETVTIVVTDDGSGNLTAETTYANGEAKFENETKPGRLTVKKETDGGGDPDEEFEFEIRLTDELGRSLDSVNIVSDRNTDSEPEVN